MSVFRRACSELIAHYVWTSIQQTDRCCMNVSHPPPTPLAPQLMDTRCRGTSTWFDGATVGRTRSPWYFTWGFTLINDYCAIKVQTTKDKHHRQLIIIHVLWYSLCYFSEVLGARPWGSPSSLFPVMAKFPKENYHIRNLAKYTSPTQCRRLLPVSTKNSSSLDCRWRTRSIVLAPTIMLRHRNEIAIPKHMHTILQNQVRRI